MTVAKAALAVIVGVLVVGAIVVFWQYVVMGVAILVAVLLMIGLANSQPAPISPAEQERRRRSFVYYQISQDIAERHESALRSDGAMAAATATAAP